MAKIFIAKNNSFINNWNLLKGRRKPFNRDKMEGLPSKYHKAIRVKRVTKVQLEKIRRKIKAEREENKIKIFLAMITAIAICAIIVLLALRLASIYTAN